MRNYILSMFLFLFAVVSEVGAQTVTIKGTVYDARTLQPVSGVSVMSSNTVGTTTDTTGQFSIAAAPGTVLQISRVGYISTTYRIAEGETNISVTMQPDETKGKLDEIVVVGFSKRSKINSVAATSTITADDIKDVPTANVAELIQGKIAGVNIQNTSGMPGARGSIFQRGLSSIGVSGEGNNAYLAMTQPLMIIDGVQIDPNTDYEYGFAQAGPGVNPLALIPAEDIESIQILKDAAATSQYGSRGAYGVWIINTKRGRSPRPQITYIGNAFVSTVPKLREVYGGRMERAIKIDQIINHNSQFSPYYGYARVNANYFLTDSLNPYLNNSTDWQSYFFKNRLNHSHNLAFSGGDPNFSYKINLGYYDEQGIVENTGYGRYSAALKADYMSANGKFKMMTAINASSASSRKGSGVGVLQTGVATSGMASSLLPPPDVYTENNLALASFYLQDDNKVNSVLSSIDIDIELLTNLRFKTTGSMDFNTSTSNTFYPSWLNSNSMYGLVTGTNSQSQYNSYGRNANSYDNRNVLSYSLALNEEKHQLSSYVFTDLNVRTATANYLLLYGTPNDYISGPIGYNLNRSRYGISSPPVNGRIFGYGGNFTYNYLSKYILELNYRIDGTSTNGPLSGFRQNPSVGVRWNAFKEGFIEAATKNWMNLLAFRGSWGRSIIPQGDVFSVFGRYNPGSTYMGQPSVILDYNSSPNPYFLPNTSEQWNFGVEMGFFNNRIAVEYDTYYKTVENIAWATPINRESGYANMAANDVSMVNYGHELSLRFVPIQKEFRWTLNVNGALNRNILTHLPKNARQMVQLRDDAGMRLPVYNRVGRASLGNYLYNTKGIYSTYGDVPVDPLTGLRQRINGIYLEAGDPQFADLNGDYIINDLDRLAIGDPQPKVTGGLINTFNYKNWGLTVNAYFTLFRDVLNTPLAAKFKMFNDPDRNGDIQSLPPVDEFNYWTGPGSDARYPDPLDYEQNRIIDPFRYNQTLFMEDGSYFKFSIITLSYAVPKPLLTRLGVKQLRTFITGKNLYTVTNYTGPNPENITDLGRDHVDSYPSARQYSFGLNVTF